MFSFSSFSFLSFSLCEKKRNAFDSNIVKKGLDIGIHMSVSLCYRIQIEFRFLSTNVRFLFHWNVLWPNIVFQIWIHYFHFKPFSISVFGFFFFRESCKTNPKKKKQKYNKVNRKYVFDLKIIKKKNSFFSLWKEKKWKTHTFKLRRWEWRQQ